MSIFIKLLMTLLGTFCFRTQSTIKQWSEKAELWEINNNTHISNTCIFCKVLFIFKEWRSICQSRQVSRQQMQPTPCQSQLLSSEISIMDKSRHQKDLLAFEYTIILTVYFYIIINESWLRWHFLKPICAVN